MESTCKDNLIKCLWQDCSTLVQGDYVIHLSRDACGKCDISLVSFSPSWADCTLVTNCINNNTATQTAINNLINARINFPSGNGQYVLNISWWVATRTPYTPSGSGSNVPNKPTTPWVYELTIDGSGNATWTIATSGGSWSCSDTENCIRTNSWVQDAIKDLIFGNWNTTLCAAITAAWCAWWSPVAPAFRYVDSTNNCNWWYPSWSCTINASTFTWTSAISYIEFDIELVANNWAAEPDFTHFTWYYDYAAWLFYWVQRRPVNHTWFGWISQMMGQALNWVTQITAADSESFDTVVANWTLSINQLSTTSFELRHNVFYSWTTSNTWYVRWTYKVY